MLVWSRIKEAIEGHGAAALVSVVAVAGSAPREAGARIVLLPDGGFWGTVGGGALEWELIREAREALAVGRGPAQVRDWPLGPDLGQCCGGRVTSLVETFDRSDAGMVAELAAAEMEATFETQTALDEFGRVARLRLPIEDPDFLPPRQTDLRRPGGVIIERFGDDDTPVLLFGAGHVGRALALALAPLPFRLRWVDTRDDAFPALIPANAVAVCTPTPEAEIATAPAHALVMIMTHSHPLDLALTTAALHRTDLGGVGLIGSAIKKVRFVKRMREAGLADSALARLTCPIGVSGIGGKEPAVIAAAVAAQLLQWRDVVAASKREPASLRTARAASSGRMAGIGRRG